MTQTVIQDIDFLEKRNNEGVDDSLVHDALARLSKVSLEPPQDDVQLLSRRIVDFLALRIEKKVDVLDSKRIGASELAPTLRLWRNFCCTLKETRNLISCVGKRPLCSDEKPQHDGENAFFKISVSRFLKTFALIPDNQNDVVAARCLAQALTNSLADHPVNQRLFAEDPILRRSLVSLIQIEDDKCGVYSCALLTTCLCDEEAAAALLADSDVTVACLSRIPVIYERSESPWPILALKKMWGSPTFADRYVDVARFDYALEALLSWIQEVVESRDSETKERTGNDADVIDVSVFGKGFVSNLERLVTWFNDQARTIFGASKVSPTDNFLVVLDILCAASSNASVWLAVLQNSSDLVMTATTILVQLTMVKERAKAENCAGSVTTTTTTTTNGNSTTMTTGASTNVTTTNHFHRDVVRLIANLTWKHRRNQDLVRELGGVVAVLNSFDVNDDSPYVRQWATFALRNLTEGNETNQKVLAELQLKGVEDADGTLERMGLEVEIEGGRPRLSRKSVKEEE